MTVDYLIRVIKILMSQGLLHVHKRLSILV